MNKRIIILLLILLPVLLPLRSQAANGFPLDGFGNYSAVKISGVGIRAIAVQRWDGRVVIGGDFTVTDYSAATPIVRTNLARLNTDGTLDASFALNPEKEIRAVAVDSVNKVIYAGGLSGNIGGQWRNGLARISSLGVLDGFNPAAANSEIDAITVQQGSVLVGGTFSSMSGLSCSNIARIYDDGSPTDTFSGGVSGGEVQAILVQDGMVVVGGSFTSWGGFTPDRPHLARFTASGAPDETFYASPGAPVRALALQADGMILVGGDFTDVTTGTVAPSTQARNYLARLTAKGELDGFNATLDNSLPVAGHYVGSISVQPDGKILIAGNFTRVGATLRNNVARLNMNQSLDQDADPKKDFDPNADGVVDVITIQPDGKFLLGGKFAHVAGATSPAIPALRGRLARFYQSGALDEDVFSLGPTLNTLTWSGLTIPGAVMALSLQPDETVGIGGQFTFVSGKVRWRVAKLNRDWTLASQPNLPLDSEVDVLVPQPDGKLIVGGIFSDYDNGYWSARRLDPLGIPEPAFDAKIFNLQTDWDTPIYGLADTEAVALSPSGPPTPDGAPGLDIYLGGMRTGDVPFYLARLNSDGVKDTVFDTNVANAPALVPAVPFLLDGDVTAIAIQPDDKKVLVGTYTGKIMRFEANGVLDVGFSVLELDGAVTSLALQPSGQIMAAGEFTEPVTRVISPLTGEERTWDQSILRINKLDGSIDNTFNFETNGSIDSAALQADGGIVIAGTFDTDGSYDNVMDVNGVEAKRNNVARIGPNGELDGNFDLGTFEAETNSGFNTINALKLQGDGKLIIAGGFISMNNDEARQRVVRVANGWSIHELSVSPDGKEVTWLRDGPAPELWRVVFEYSADGSAWEYLGDASRIPGVAGWRLVDAKLGDKPNGWYTNHYVRATGYATAEKRGSSSLVQSVRHYYLKPILTVTAAANQSKMYGAADPVFSYDASGFVNGDTIGILTGKLSRAYGSDVGSYGITRGSLSAGDNYTVVFVGADFKITPAPLSVKADNLRKTYGSANPSLSTTPSGLVNGDNATILTGSPVLSTTALLGSPPGSYPISASIGTLAAANYTITCADGTLSVDPATLTITARNELKHYGDPNPTFSFIPSGFVNGDTQSILNGLPALTTTALTGSPAGSYPISAAAGTLTANSNYTLAFVGATLTVDPATLTITAQNAVKRYGDPNPSFTFIPSGFANGDSQSILGGLPALTTTASTGSPVGSYPISAAAGSLTAGSNYTLAFVGASLAIDPATLTITAQNAIKRYGDLNPSFTFIPNGLVNGDTQSILNGLPALTTTAVTGSPVGSYPISAAAGTLTAGGNYTLAFVGASLTIDPATLTITAQNAVKRYGDLNPSFTFIPSGLVNGDTQSILNGLPALTTTAVTGSPVGSYPISAAAGTLTAGGNYTLAFVGASLTIDPATLTITAQNAIKRYGDPNPSFTFIPSGFANGDSQSILNGLPALTTTAVTGSPVGSYPISAAAGSLTAGGNYTLAFVGASLTIDPATLTITAQNAFKRYGDPNPSFTFIPSGFVNSDTSSILGGFPALTTTALTGSPVGDYPVTAAAGTLSAGNNYIVTYTGGWLKVNAATLTITADSKSKTIGTSDPVLTFGATGFQNGDTLAIVTGGLTRAAGEAVGSYSITLGTMSAGNNYSIAFTGAELTILATGGPAPQNITFNEMRPKTFGDGDFDPGATASSNLPVDYASSASNIASVVAGKIRVLAPGSSGITASQAGDDAYLPATPVTRTLKVNPPPWNSLSFDGVDDSLRIPDAPQLNFGSKTGFSIETWLRLDGSQPDGTGIVSKGEGGSPWSGYQLILHQDRIGAEIGVGDSSIGIAEGLVAKSSLNDGQWHHVALTVDRAQATAALYLDGRLEAQLANPALNLTPDNTNPLLLGTDRTSSLFFKGDIDELRIWDTVRSQAEIRAAVSQIIDPLDEPHLAAYFHFDEGDANLDNAAFTSAPERTAYGANGSLQGFALSGTASNWTRSGAFIPLLETAPISAIGSGSATSGGVVYPNYYPATEAGLCWGTGANPGFADTCRAYGSGTGPFIGVMTGLTPGAAYHVRGYAINLMGTAYGNVVTFNANKLDQTVDIGTITDKTYGDGGFTPGGSSTSGLPITYTSSDPGVAIVVGGEIQITGAGTTTITASQGGNETYSPAGDVSQTFTVAKAPLTVTADNKSRAYLSANPILTANYLGFVNGENISVISGVPNLSTSATQASLAGTYDIVAGSGTLAAKNYSFVLKNGTLSVFKSCQEIVFPAIGERTFGDPPFAIIASACSGLGISFTSSDPQVAQINGNIVTVTGAGSVVITASQPGNGSLETAPDVSQTVIVHKSGQGVTFSSLAQKVLGDPPFALSATASSGLTVNYLSSDPSVAVVSGNLVTIVGAGTTVITAVQGGNLNYNAALPASQPLTVALEGVPPLLALSALASGAVTSDPVLNIMGTAGDASGIASLTVNGVDLTGEAALFSSAVPLATGDNSISVSAKDGAGNQTTQILSITLDAAAPAVAVSAPADNSVSDVSLFTVIGSVTPGSAVSLLVNGGSPLTLDVTDGSFTGSGYLENGVNTLELVAALSGRSARVKRSVTLAPGKPTLALTEPVEDVRTELESVTLSGLAKAQGSEVSVIIEVDGSVFTPTVQTGVFRQTIVLNHAGQFRIKVSATDSGGNTSVAYRNIIKVDRIPGDLNGDGRVDVEDAVALLRISLGLDPPTAQALAHGDVAPVVNGVSEPDGRIDVGDVLVLLRKIVGLVDF